MVLAILGDPGDDSPAVIVGQTLKSLKSTAKDELALGRFLRQLEVLSKLRNVQEEVIKQKEAMPIIYDLETDIRYLQGKQKGAEEATVSGLMRGLKEGRLEGREEGLEEGREKGIREAKEQDVLGLLQLNVLMVDQIATALNVSPEFVQNVQVRLR